MRELKTILILALILGSCLALANYFSQPMVAEQRQAFEARKLQEVVGSRYQVLPSREKDAYLLQQENRVVGQLIQVTTLEGYNGRIVYWLGVDSSETPKIVGVRVISHQETPGLGDKLELEVSDWILSFNDLTLADAVWDVNKYGGDFDQWSGATITPRALVRSVANELEQLELELAHKRELP